MEGVGAGRTGLGAPLRVREFRFLWLAELFSIAGDQLARVALALLVFARTSSAGLTALTYALTFVPSILGGALLSGLADRFPRRGVLVVTDLVRAALAAAMAWPGLPLPLLWVLVGLLSVAAGPFKAAHLSILPQILPDGDGYRAGVALRQITNQTAQLVGFGAGGLLLTVIEPRLGMLLNAATFLVGAALVTVGVRNRPASRREVSERTVATRPLWPVFALVSLVGLYVVPEGLAAPYAEELGIAAVGVGMLMAADPVGGIVGGWLANRSRVRVSPATAVSVAVAAGVPLVVCDLQPGLVVSAVLWAVSGAFSTVYLVQTQQLMVDLVPDDRRGAAMGRLATCLYSSQGIAILGGGLLAEVFGPFRAVAAAGLLAIVLALVIGCWWLARSRREHAGNEPDRSPHRSLFAMAGSSSPGHDSPGNSPTTSATQRLIGGEAGDRLRNGNVRDWRLWKLPHGARNFLLAVEVATVSLTVVLAVRHPVTTKAAVAFAVIVTLGVLVAEVTKRVERERRRFSDTPHVNMSSVWTLSAALVTTPALAAATTIVLYLHLWYRSWRHVIGMSPFRVVFSTCVVVVSCHAAFLVDRGSLPPDSDRPEVVLGLLLVIVVYWCVNSGLIAGAIALLRSDRSPGSLLGSWSENSLEYATLSVGALTALLLSWYPWAVVLVLLPLFVLHRSVLVRQLEHAATIDSKTGLFNIGTWQSLASAEIDRAMRHSTQLGLLMIDIDHFKRVNDRYNHLVGDQALRAVADAIRGSVRSYDLCGKFGGEEFVVLLAGAGRADSLEVGNRICERVRTIRVADPISGGAYEDLHLSVSIGVANFPDEGRQLNELLMAADNAVFAAKDAGRDRVVAEYIKPV